MDATKLIEEAEIWARELRESTFADRRHYGEKFAALAAALKASEEQNKATPISLRCAEANLKAAIAETEPVKSANLAANKRIVELEHERDAARAELARLTTPQPGEPLDLDCGDSSCAFAKTRGGMRTNGGCRCLENLGFCRGQTDSLRRMAAEIVSLRKRLSDLTTPRPIAEAPRDGTWVIGLWDKAWRLPPSVMKWRDGEWWSDSGQMIGRMTEYLPLPEVKP